MHIGYQLTFPPGYRIASWCTGWFIGSLLMFGIDLAWLRYATSWFPAEESYTFWWGASIIVLALYLLYLADDEGLWVFWPWMVTLILEGCILFLLAQ